MFIHLHTFFSGPEHEEDELVAVVTCSLCGMLIAKIDFNIWFDFYGFFSEAFRQICPFGIGILVGPGDARLGKGLNCTVPLLHQCPFSTHKPFSTSTENNISATFFPEP